MFIEGVIHTEGQPSVLREGDQTRRNIPTVEGIEGVVRIHFVAITHVVTVRSDEVICDTSAVLFARPEHAALDTNAWVAVTTRHIDRIGRAGESVELGVASAATQRELTVVGGALAVIHFHVVAFDLLEGEVEHAVQDGTNTTGNRDRLTRSNCRGGIVGAAQHVDGRAGGVGVGFGAGITRDQASRAAADFVLTNEGGAGGGDQVFLLDAEVGTAEGEALEFLPWHFEHKTVLHALSRFRGQVGVTTRANEALRGGTVKRVAGKRLRATQVGQSVGEGLTNATEELGQGRRAEGFVISGAQHEGFDRLVFNAVIRGDAGVVAFAEFLKATSDGQRQAVHERE